MAREFSELSQYEVDPAAAALLPLEYCLDRGVAILGKLPAEAASPLSVAVLRPESRRLCAELEDKLSRRVTPVQLNAFEIRQAIAKIYQLPANGEVGALLRVRSDRQIEFTAGQPPAKMIEDLLAVAIRRRATDVHLETYQRDVDLRFRIDGVLHQMTTPLSPDNIGRVVSRIKVLCELDLAERRHAQDGRFSVLFDDEGRTRRVDVRVSVLPGVYGQDIALRLLDPDRFILDLDRTDMPPRIAERYRELIRYPHGLLLATGPTGSGKTTSLYASLRELQGDNLKIVTAEDPIEFEFPKVNQKHVTPLMGFADHLRAFLRSNPDVILVGEIRDAETAEIAIRAATTGHLILSTLHTRDSIAAVARLRALGVSDDYLSEVLVGILGQRLVRRICARCREETVPSPKLAARFFPSAPAGPFWRGKGCEACGGSGYQGLVGVFELLEPDEEIAAAIARGTPVGQLRHIARARGWEPLIEDALRKVAQGLTSLEEVARRIPSRLPSAVLPLQSTATSHVP